MERKLAPLSIRDEYARILGPLDSIGQTPDKPFNAILDSTQRDVARRVYNLAKERSKPVFFSFNRSVFVVEITEGKVTYQLVKADSNSVDMVDEYVNTFNQVGQEVSS